MKNINLLMRSLHRNVGFLALGMFLIYAVSGIVLIFRNTDFLKVDKNIEKTLDTQMTSSELAAKLKIKSADFLSEDQQTIKFKTGVYDKLSGNVSYDAKELVFPINKLIPLHKMTGDSPAHWFGVVFGVAMLILSISSFWMFKPKTKLFKKGLVLTAIGFVISLLLLLVVN